MDCVPTRLAKHTRVAVSTIAALATAMLAACSASGPSLADGRTVLRNDAAVPDADASVHPMIDGAISTAKDAATDGAILEDGAAAPDSSVTLLDAAIGSPDAQIGSPDAQISAPDARSSAPDAHISAPDAAPIDAAPIDAPQIDARVTAPDAAVVIDAAASADAGLTPAIVGRGSPGFAYDSVRNRIVMFAGDLASGGVSDGTAEWNGSAWTDVSPQPNPSPSLRSDINGMVYDTAMAKCFLFGGAPNGVGSQYLGDSWTWDGTTWTQLTLTPSPPARNTYGLAYDSVRQVIVLFGGVAVGARANDTWEFNGTTWSQKSPTHSPSTRNAVAMVYDSTHHQTVMFGGYTAASGPSSEIWTWDGTDWTQHSPVHSPSARYFPSLADDPINSDVILFGGDAGPDTWKWDGTDWTQLSPALLPAGAGGMTYDSALQRIVLFAPPTATSTTDLTYTWEGTNWVER